MFFDDGEIAELIKDEIRYGLCNVDSFSIDEILLFNRVKTQWPGMSRKRFKRILRSCLFGRNDALVRVAV